MKTINWKTPPLELKLLDNEVHLWRANLEIERQEIERLTKLLTEDEIVRANRFKFTEHRQRFIAARGYLRKILRNYLQIPNQEIIFEYSDRGKPKLLNSTLQFNLSHSQNIALYGFTKNNLIGVDIECLSSKVEYLKVAQRFYNQREYQFISQLKPERQLLAFFGLWTIKEAYLKATGEGLVGGLEAIEIAIDSELNFKVLDIRGKSREANNWYFGSFIPHNNFVGAIATRLAKSETAINEKQQNLTIKQYTLN